MIPCPESYHAPFWSARVDEFNWTDETFPALRELLCDLFLPRQHVWNREIVLTENSPNPSSCKQVSRVVDWAQYLPQSTKKCRLLLTLATPDPAEYGSVAIPIGIHTELSSVLVNRALVL